MERGAGVLAGGTVYGYWQRVLGTEHFMRGTLSAVAGKQAPAAGWPQSQLQLQLQLHSQPPLVVSCGLSEEGSVLSLLIVRFRSICRLFALPRG